MDESTNFKRRRVLTDRLIPYGFTKVADGFTLSTRILEGQFKLTVKISKDSKITTQLIDVYSNEEYILHHIEGAVGSFTGAVRKAYNDVMIDIATKCFEPDVFKTAQARELISYVRENYKDELEFLWEKFPDNAIWRRKDNSKWYGALLAVSKCKLGLKSDEIIEIIDLRIAPEELAALLDGVNYLPGYHMNKKNWYTICLDGSVTTNELIERIDRSYSLAAKNTGQYASKSK